MHDTTFAALAISRDNLLSYTINGGSAHYF